MTLFDAKDFLKDLGIEPSKDYTEEQLAQMTDHELLMLKFVELNDYEEKLVIEEMNRRGYGPENEE